VCEARGGVPLACRARCLRVGLSIREAARLAWQGPSAMPVYNSAGYNTSTYAYPQYEHNTPYYNEFQDIEIRACCPPSLLPSLRPATALSPCSLASQLNGGSKAP
jgi:hypothetical protein